MTPGNASTTGPVAASRTSAHPATAAAKRLLRQYVYFCTSKASKMSTCTDGCDLHEHLACEPPAYVSLRQHTSAYVSIRQHTSAYISIRQLTSAYVSIRQHTSAHVSTRQHTSAHVSTRQHTSAHVSIRQHTWPRCLRAPGLFWRAAHTRQHTSAHVSIPGRTARELQVSFGEPHILEVSFGLLQGSYVCALSRCCVCCRCFRCLRCGPRAHCCGLRAAYGSIRQHTSASASAASAAAAAPLAPAAAISKRR
jgi:hypothetical protein